MKLLFKSIYILVAILFTIINKISAQGFYNNNYTSESKWEVSINFGPSNFFGDIGTNKGIAKKVLKENAIPTSDWFIGGHLTYFLKEWAGLRGGINIGKLETHDADIDATNYSSEGRKFRNLDFKSGIQEFYLAAEIYPTAFTDEYLNTNWDGKLKPYFVIGGGFFHFQPKGTYNAPDGSTPWVNLKPLKLEGQGMKEYSFRKEYSNWAIQIPFGFGLKYIISDNFFVGGEFLFRYSTTDYIDDVSTTYIDPTLFDSYLSPTDAAIAKQMHYKRALLPNAPDASTAIGQQRGNSKTNDYYYSLLLKFGMNLNGGYSGDPHRKPTYKRYY